MASIPKVTVEVAFDGGPFSAAYTWTDISDYVKGFQVRRGRNNELDRIEAGTLSVTLDNSDGRFTPGKRKAGGNILSGNLGQVIWDLNGRANNTVMSSINVGQVDDDQKPRVMSRTVYTSGAPVAGYFAVKWLDASGSTLRFVAGTRFVADSSPAVYTHEETPPAGVATAVVYLYADTYPEGNAGLTAYGEKAEWYKTQPYYPYVIPRRRVRVRTANLSPKDVSTGGDISHTSAQFSTSHSPGATSDWTRFHKSGVGSVLFNCGSNGPADYASSIRCGYVDNGKPVGLARVAPGQTYSARVQVRQGEASPQLSVKQLVRWYDASGAYLSSTGDSPTVALVSGQWLPVTLSTVTAPAGAAWAGLSIGTSGGDGGGHGYFYIDEIQFEQGATLADWNPGGSIFHGYIEKWPVTSEGLTATVEVSAVDGFSVLSNTDLRGALQAEILTTGPLGYWPLGDPVGSTRLENLANDQQPARLVASKYGAGTPLLGADSIVKKDATTCYNLANVASNQGTVVDICDGGQRRYPLGTDFSVAFWCLPVRPSPGLYTTLFAGWSDTAADFLWIRLDSNGNLQISTTYTEGTQTTFPVWPSLSTSTPSFVVVTIERGVTRVYLNGIYRLLDQGPTPTNKDIRDLRWASFAGRQAGSIYGEYANGRMAHLAIWDRCITFAELDEIWRLGDNSGADFPEDEQTRIARIATMANFWGETAYDGGMSTLQGPDWSAGASALDELQQTAEDASGYLFMDGDGRLTYHNRDRRQGAAVRYELSDSLGLPYEPGLQFEMDEDRIINEVSYKRTNGTEGVVKDQVSVDAFGRKSKSIELRLSSDSAVQDAAYTLLNHYSTPVVRCDSVTLNATATPGLFMVALGVEIGDRITLSDLPSQAPESSLDYYVEAIETDVSVDGGTLQWVTTLALSPAENSDVWVLEDPTLGRLDRTTVLAY
ncbi:LamG-like jellyroll fold domain-containing protein [Streptomyces sp. NPDC048637]|uniref:LamG-like jellyroll fold domain-containing protein n=1 Tax=Streptomyces sp. NPDC048637 TaxID=3155636 RepID=UPI003440DA4E